MYNPFDLVPMKINDKEIFGRPVSLDSDIICHKTMKNAFGNIVKPNKLSSTCPDCGQGILVDVLLDFPFYHSMTCPHCNPVKELEVPFVNPVKDVKELDPINTDIVIKEMNKVEGTVAERLEKKHKKKQPKKKPLVDKSDSHKREKTIAIPTTSKAVDSKDEDVNSIADKELNSIIKEDVNSMEDVIQASIEENMINEDSDFSLEELLGDEEIGFDDGDMIDP